MADYSQRFATLEVFTIVDSLISSPLSDPIA